MSSYSPVRSTSMMSGMQVTGCLLKGNPLTCLWLKSPIERVRFSPLILPLTIWAPAFSIRYFSCGFLRSWSKERGTHLFPCHRAALESPALAHTIFSGVMPTTTAVAPACSSYLEAGRFSYSLLYLRSSSIPGFSFIVSSTWMNVSVSACPMFPYSSAFRCVKISTKCAATYLLTYAPP